MTPRAVALTLGVSFVVLTALELIIGRWTVGETELLVRTTRVNLFHAAVAMALLSGFFSGAKATRIVPRIVGLALLGIGTWGFVAPESLGDFLGFSGEIPPSYKVLHVLAAAGALFGGFASARKAV